MKVPCILAAAAVFSGHLLIGSALAALLAGTDSGLTSTPTLMLAQGEEPISVTSDRMARIRQHRSIIESALQPPRQAMPAEPAEPLARALEAPEPLLSTGPEEQVSCEAAAGIVAEYGFADVRPTDCSGELYRFSATRDGTAYAIGITAAAGEIAEVSRQ